MTGPSGGSRIAGEPGPRRFGWAWVGLALALGAHVADEALTNFLSVYNPAVQAIRQRTSWIPLPTFTFPVWLGGLILLVTILLLLSPFAFRGAWWVVWLAYPLSAIMLLNGLGHVAGTIYLRRPMPGVYSSPLLLAAASYLLVQAAHWKGSKAR